MQSRAAVEALAICLGNPLSASLHRVPALSRLSCSSRALSRIARSSEPCLGRWHDIRPSRASSRLSKCRWCAVAPERVSAGSRHARQTQPCRQPASRQSRATVTAAAKGSDSGSGSSSSGGGAGGGSGGSGGGAAVTPLERGSSLNNRYGSRSDVEYSSQVTVDHLRQAEAGIKAALKRGDVAAAHQAYQQLEHLGAAPSDDTCELLLKGGPGTCRSCCS